MSSWKSVAVLSEISWTFSISSLNFSYELPPVFESGNLYSSDLFFSSVIIKMEFYTFRLVNLIIQSPLIWIGGLKWNVSLGLVILNSKVSSAFLWVCVISVSQFLVKYNNKSSLWILGWIKFKFFQNSCNCK